MKTHSVVQGISSLNWENAHVGQLPNRVFKTMVDNDAYTESIAKILREKCPNTEFFLVRIFLYLD